MIKHFYGLISSRMTKPPPEKQEKVIECFDEYENNMDYIYYLLDFGLMCFIPAAELKSNCWGAIKPVGSGGVKPYWLRMTISLQQETKPWFPSAIYSHWQKTVSTCDDQLVSQGLNMQHRQPLGDRHCLGHLLGGSHSQTDWQRFNLCLINKFSQISTSLQSVQHHYHYIPEWFGCTLMIVL